LITRFIKEWRLSFLKISNLSGNIGLCRKAGKLIIGAAEVKEGIISKKVKIILLASDAAENTASMIERNAQMYNIPLVKLPLSKKQLGHAIGMKDVAVTGIIDSGFAKSFSNIEI